MDETKKFGRYARCIAALSASFLLSACGLEKVPPSGPPQSAPKKMATQGAIEMVKIPGGDFTMGDDGGEADERPAHAVKISGFYMDACEVTQESYQALMGTNPAKHKNPKNPVEQLGWFGAVKYCNMRSMKEGLKPCYDLETLACDFGANGYRLPTEAEWEYACRAGTKTPFSFSGGSENLHAAGWFEGNAAKTPHPVGEKTPNPWGLFDMHGNVYEWCNDIYSDAYYAETAKQGSSENPRNTGAGDERVLRGGAWNSEAELCRSSARFSEAPGLADVCFGYDAYGFRCVRRIAEN